MLQYPNNVYFDTPITPIVSGTYSNEVVGRCITLKGIERKFYFTNNGSAYQDNPAMVRILCLKVDPYLVSGSVAASRIFTNTGTGNTQPVCNWSVSQYKDPNLPVVQKVYYDRLIHMPAVKISGQYTSITHTARVPLHNLKYYLEADTNSGTYGSKFDIIWVCVAYREGIAAAAIPVAFDYADRVWYKNG